MYKSVALVCALALLLQPRLRGDIVDTLANLPQMAPEECALQAPDAMLDKLLAMDPRPEGVGGCEACTDNFYDAYARQLARKTDADYPAARIFRPLLLKSFETCFDYLVSVHHSNGTRHLGNRIAGEVEWIIFTGAKQNYNGSVEFGESDLMNAWFDDESKYTRPLIGQIGTAIGRANASPLDHFDHDMLPIFRRSLKQLTMAERTMTDDQKRWFRRYFAFFLTRLP